MLSSRDLIVSPSFRALAEFSLNYTPTQYDPFGTGPDASHWATEFPIDTSMDENPETSWFK